MLNELDDVVTYLNLYDMWVDSIKFYPEVMTYHDIDYELWFIDGLLPPL